MATKKLEELNDIITNLIRARQDCVATVGDTDITIVGYMDAKLLTGLNDGAKEAKEAIISEAMLTVDESKSIFVFYSLRRQVLDILQTETKNEPFSEVAD